MKKWLKNLRKDERGLTLVELLAVIVILAIVGAIAFVSIGNIIENTKKDAHVANALQVISAAKLYEAGGGELSSTGTKFSEIDTIVKNEMTDPWNNETYKDFEQATISKDDDGKYRVKLNTDDNKCKIDHFEKTLREDGRKACTSPEENSS